MVTLGQLRRKVRVWPDLVVDIPASYEYTSGGVVESTFAAAVPGFTYGKRYEAITYTTKRKKERHLSNYCSHLHYLRGMSSNPLDPIVFFNQNPGHVGHKIVFYSRTADDLCHDQSVLTAYGASQLNVASDAVYYGNPQTDIDMYYFKCQPDLTALSLPNFLLELDDVGKLFQLWKKKLSIAKNVSGAHLNYSFGWKPLMSDIRAMTDILQSVMDKIAAFEKAANQMLYRTETVFHETVAKQGTFNYQGNSSNPCSWYGSVERRKKAYLSYSPQPFQVTKGYTMMLRAYMDALGFELNPRILWDALPFTFVLDWFFGIGSWLEQHKYDTLNLPFLHVDSGMSYKELVTVTSQLRSNQNPALLLDKITRPSWVTSRRYFNRVPCTPSGSVFAGLGWKKPTSNQALLGVSLVNVLRHT